MGVLKPKVEPSGTVTFRVPASVKSGDRPFTRNEQPCGL